jgi:hypothetical protein
MIEEDGRLGSPKDKAQDQRGDDRVVERPQHRDELGDQVDRRDEPREREPDEALRPSRDARVADETAEQDHEVGDEAGDLARLRLPAEGQQDQDREEPDGDPDDHRDHEPSQHDGSLAVAPVGPGGASRLRAGPARYFTHTDRTWRGRWSSSEKVSDSNGRTIRHG